MNKGLRWTRSLVRSLGYDVVRFPRESHREHVQAVFSKLGINFVLDVGANRGAFVQLVRDAGFTGPVASFDPVDENVALLTAASAKDRRWTVHRLALGHQNGAAPLSVSRDSRFSSFRPASEYARESFPESAVERREDVRVARLDSIFEEIAPPGDVRSFLKVDTQGWELEVIEGATGCLKKICAIQCEVAVQPLYEDAPSYLDALPRLNELGFELSGVFPVARDDALRIVGLDCVLVRAS